MRQKSIIGWCRRRMIRQVVPATERIAAVSLALGLDAVV
jgi:hypothetical protein